MFFFSIVGALTTIICVTIWSVSQIQAHLIYYHNYCVPVQEELWISSSPLFCSCPALPPLPPLSLLSVVSLMMSPISDSFLSGSLDHTIRLWDLRSQNCQGLMHLNGRPVASYDPEGLIFVAGIDSRQLKLYDLRTFDKVCWRGWGDRVEGRRGVWYELQLGSLWDHGWGEEGGGKKRGDCRPSVFLEKQQMKQN